MKVFSFKGIRWEIGIIARIHDDVLKVWNFNDPLQVSPVKVLTCETTLTPTLQLLSGAEFWKGMTGLVEPLRDVQDIQNVQ